MLIDLGKLIKHFEVRTFFTVKDVYGRDVDVISREDLLNEFKAMAVKDSLTTDLTWEDIRKIIDIYQRTAKLTKDGEMRKQEDVFKEVLKRLKENN